MACRLGPTLEFGSLLVPLVVQEFLSKPVKLPEDVPPLSPLAPHPHDDTLRGWEDLLLLDSTDWDTLHACCGGQQPALMSAQRTHHGALEANLQSGISENWDDMAQHAQHEGLVVFPEIAAAATSAALAPPAGTWDAVIMAPGIRLVAPPLSPILPYLPPVLPRSWEAAAGHHADTHVVIAGRPVITTGAASSVPAGPRRAFQGGGQHTAQAATVRETARKGSGSAGCLQAENPHTPCRIPPTPGNSPSPEDWCYQDPSPDVSVGGGSAPLHLPCPSSGGCACTSRQHRYTPPATARSAPC